MDAPVLVGEGSGRDVAYVDAAHEAVAPVARHRLPQVLEKVPRFDHQVQLRAQGPDDRSREEWLPAGEGRGVQVLPSARPGISAPTERAEHGVLTLIGRDHGGAQVADQAFAVLSELAPAPCGLEAQVQLESGSGA